MGIERRQFFIPNIFLNAGLVRMGGAGTIEDIKREPINILKRQISNNR